MDIKERRYTRDHNWVDFYESYAIAGIGRLKLTGIRHIDKIIPLHATGGFVREGQILATLFSKEYHIIMHMPVDGYVLKINDSLTGAEVLANTEKEVWIAIITPWDPDHRNQLMQ